MEACLKKAAERNYEVPKKRTKGGPKMDDVKIYCRKCGCEVNDTDNICPNCKSDLRSVGRNMTVLVTDTLSISDSVSITLTKAEQNTLKKIESWLKRNIGKFELSEVVVGFPSGVKVTFTKRKE